MAKASMIARRTPSALDLLDLIDPSTPTGIQLLATSADELTRALAVIEEEVRGQLQPRSTMHWSRAVTRFSHTRTQAAQRRPHLRNLCAVDLNFGCPNPDIISMGAGPAMLKRRSRLEAMFAALAAWRESSALPVRAVGAKIRLGLNQFEMDKQVYIPVTQVREGFCVVPGVSNVLQTRWVQTNGRFETNGTQGSLADIYLDIQ
jgi:hypothetical protein